MSRRRWGRNLRHSAASPRAPVTLFLLVSLAMAATSVADLLGSPVGGFTGTLETGASMPPDHQTVNVLYAGSLTGLMERHLGPAFTATTGDGFSGRSAGSSALANEIKGRLVRGDVFVSASPAVNRTLEGRTNGSWVKWHITFARSPLVLGYDPSSRFASALRRSPWYDVVTRTGFILGRTDPRLDPKGALTVQAVHEAAAQRRDRSLESVLDNSSVFPEETLVGRLQAGQLDAGFFYASEARAAGIPTVPLPGSNLSADYTVTVLRGAPHPSAARAFTAFLLGPRGRSISRMNGLELVRPPAVSGGRPPDAIMSASRRR